MRHKTERSDKKARGRLIPAVATFRSDPLFPRIERAVADILATGKVVAPVDVLVRMDLLSREKLEDWRRGRVPYLEGVINCNLTRLSRLLRILQFHAPRRRDLGPPSARHSSSSSIFSATSTRDTTM